MKFQMNFWLDEIISEFFSSTGFIPDGYLLFFHKNSKVLPIQGLPVSVPSHYYMVPFTRLRVTMRPQVVMLLLWNMPENKVDSALPGILQFDSIIHDFPVWYLENESQHLLSLGSKLITLYSAKLPFHASSYIASFYDYKGYS